jgi:hypothetical protein
MVAALVSGAELEPLTRSEPSTEAGLRWTAPTQFLIDRGLFAKALRAAAAAWLPNRPDAPVARSVTAPSMGLPDVLAAWRATERELATMSGDSPEQELLEANVAMLRAMYQRLYAERALRSSGSR